jgi:hypothetical protein
MKLFISYLHTRQNQTVFENINCKLYVHMGAYVLIYRYKKYITLGAYVWIVRSNPTRV